MIFGLFGKSKTLKLISKFPHEEHGISHEDFVNPHEDFEKIKKGGYPTYKIFYILNYSVILFKYLKVTNNNERQKYYDLTYKNVINNNDNF